MFTHARSFAATCVAMFALLVSGCGGGGDPVSPIGPPPVIVPPVATVIAVTISGQTAVLVGVPLPLRAIARFSDGSEKDVTMEATWSSTDGLVRLVPGQLTAYAPGNVFVQARFGGMVGAINLIVAYPAPVSWSSLPYLSEEGKAWVKAHNLNSLGMVTRWKDTIKVWAQPALLQKAREGLAPWQEQMKDLLTIVFVADSSTANVVSVYDSLFTDFNGSGVYPCGAFSYTVQENNGIMTGLVRVRPGVCDTKTTLAHEYGHMLGLLGHTPPATDVLSPGGVWSNPPISALMKEVSRWLYLVPLGTRIAN